MEWISVQALKMYWQRLLYSPTSCNEYHKLKLPRAWCYAKYTPKFIGKYLVRFIRKCIRSNDSIVRQIRDHSHEDYNFA